MDASASRCAGARDATECIRHCAARENHARGRHDGDVRRVSRTTRDENGVGVVGVGRVDVGVRRGHERRRVRRVRGAHAFGALDRCRARDVPVDGADVHVLPPARDADGEAERCASRGAVAHGGGAVRGGARVRVAGVVGRGDARRRCVLRSRSWTR